VEYVPGSRRLKAQRWEQYARHRASALNRINAYRKVYGDDYSDRVAAQSGYRLETRRSIRDRIEYLTRMAEDRIAEKRARIEQQLWDIHEADPADFFEHYEGYRRGHDGQPEHDSDGNKIKENRQRPKLLSDISPENRKLIEDLQPDGRGRLIPKLYSKSQANKELRAMLNFGRSSDQADITKLSDQELISTLAQQAKELGINIDLKYTFHEPNKDEPDDK
jgi:hypothetical protein